MENNNIKISYNFVKRIFYNDFIDKKIKTHLWINIFLKNKIVQGWDKNVKNKDKRKLLTIKKVKIDWKKVSKVIRKIKYEDFLKTNYWQGVKKYVLYKNNYTCQMCGCANKKMHIHHPNYKFHGREAKNTKKLICLCEDCHKKIHKIK